jgi:hypothetical protein
MKEVHEFVLISGEGKDSTERQADGAAEVVPIAVEYKARQVVHQTTNVKTLKAIAIMLKLSAHHQKQHHVPYSLAISINGTFLLIHGIASTLWAFQYVFLIIYFRYFLFLVIFSCPSETVPYLRNFYFRKFGFPSIFIFLYFHLI